MPLFLFSPTTSRVVTVIGIPWFELVGLGSAGAAAWPLLSALSRLRSASKPASILFRCSGVNPPAYLSIYFDPCSAIASGIEVMATFWSIPAITCGATISLLSLSNWMVGPLPPPNEIGFSPKPCGTIKATVATPAFTAASAVAAVYSGCSTPCFGPGLRSTDSDPSRSRPRIKLCEVALWSSSTTIRLTLGMVSCRPPKITAKIVKKPIGRMKLRAKAPRSRRRPVRAVRTIAKINRVTPFRSSAGTRIQGWVSAAKCRPVHVPPWSRRRAVRLSQSHERR